MTFGTLLPLATFLISYVPHLTLVGAPIARAGYRFGIWLSTFGQDPPGKEKLDARKKNEAGEESKSFAERVRAYSPAGYLERRGRPVPFALRVIWFVLAGWWLGAIWVVLSWSVFLAPYPFTATVAALLGELPSVMTLAFDDPGAGLAARDAVGEEKRDDREQRENGQGGS
jgi:uncharacterized membrane protein YccF (DUF307 family)